MVVWRMGRWRDPLRGPVPASDEGGGRHSCCSVRIVCGGAVLLCGEE